MNERCRKLQDRLVDEGPRTLRSDTKAQAHVVECSDCFAFVEALSEIDGGLRNLPHHDAPNAVVESLLARPELRADPDSHAATTHADTLWRIGARRLIRPVMWGSVAAAVLLLVVFASVQRLGGRPGPTDLMKDALDKESQDFLVSDSRVVSSVDSPLPPPDLAAQSREPAGDFFTFEESETEGKGDETFQHSEPAGSEAKRELERKAIARARNKRTEVKNEAGGPGDLRVRVVDAADQSPLPGATVVLTHQRQLVAESVSQTDVNGVAVFPVLRPGDGYVIQVSFPGYAVARADARVAAGTGSSVVFPLGEELSEVETVVATRQVVDLEKSTASTTFGDDFIQDLPVQGRFYTNVLTAAPGVQDQDRDPNVHGASERDFATIVGGVSSPDAEEAVRRAAAEEAPRGAARAFLAERRSLGGLSFKPATGYWTNAYVPGDPTLRVLQARLARVDPATVAEALGSEWAFHERSRPTAQPFDPPTDSALEVYLHADRPSLDAEGRLLVQVGLQGTPRHAGRRSVLNVGVVLDLRGTVEAHQAASIRALLEAFWQARNPGDRFSVTVAGRPGGTVIEPDEFRHGYLSVTADRLLGSAAPPAEPGMGIVEAVTTAIEHVAAGDDPERPLGSSSVIVITTRPFGSDTETLTHLAHRSAVAGAPVSVVGIGAAPELAEIDRVTLAGHGRRRWMTAPGEAADVVDRELSAASRAVARAVRLRIRLAPGVKLIDVLAAERLDETQAVLVREAERAIDQRLARNLGIEADRGEDEDGIQIVIPSFYAGDSHVILLDVTAHGPGSIADVTVRYKDLVHLRNSVARAGLTIDATERKAGPLELNVLKNLLALEVSQAMDKAGEALRSGNTDEAVVTLRDARDLLTGIVVEIPELGNDPEIGNDIAMLDGYGGLMKADTAAGTVLADSLRYAARLRVLPRPEVQ